LGKTLVQAVSPVQKELELYSVSPYSKEGAVAT